MVYPESEDGAEEEITDMTSEDIIATLPEYAEDNDTQSAIQVALFQHLHDMYTACILYEINRDCILYQRRSPR